MELQEFGELASGPRHEARIVLEVSVVRGQRTLDLRRHEVARLIENFSTPQLVEALSGELDALIDLIIDDLLELGVNLEQAEAGATTASTGNF